MTKVSQEKKKNAAWARRLRYFERRKSSDIEFIPPKEYESPRFFGHHHPIDRNVNHLDRFFIPEKEHKKLIAIFEEHKIPERLHRNLIWVYLNMCFAAGISTWSDQFQKDQQWKERESFVLFDLCEEILSGKKILRGFSLVTREALTNGKYGPLKASQFKGHMAANFLTKVLSRFKEVDTYEVAMKFYKFIKQDGFPRSNMGFKNTSKMDQSLYAHAIYTYLSQELFQPNSLSEDDRLEYDKIENRLLRVYSKNKRCLLIGKLMMMSGLTEYKEELTDLEITDFIKKKLQPYFDLNKGKFVKSKNGKKRTSKR